VEQEKKNQASNDNAEAENLKQIHPELPEPERESDIKHAAQRIYDQE